MNDHEILLELLGITRNLFCWIEKNSTIPQHARNDLQIMYDRLSLLEGYCR